MGQPCTLYIPHRLYRRLSRVVPSWHQFLGRILHLNRGLRRGLARSNSIYTRYQPRGQNLKVLSFRPDPEDWARLGLLAHSLGYSRCAIFTRLARLFLKGLGGMAAHAIKGVRIIFRGGVFRRLLVVAARAGPL